MARSVIIICVLFQGILHMLCAEEANTDLEAQLRTAEEARRSVEARYEQLIIETAGREAELNKLRERLADEVKDNKVLHEELDSLRLKAGNIIVNHDDLSDARLLEQVRRDMVQLQSLQKELERHINDMQQGV